MCTSFFNYLFQRYHVLVDHVKNGRGLEAAEWGSERIKLTDEANTQHVKTLEKDFRKRVSKDKLRKSKLGRGGSSENASHDRPLAARATSRVKLTTDNVLTVTKKAITV